jgi:two-component system phosphate regulon sensor histidine kinase PhoR
MLLKELSNDAKQEKISQYRRLKMGKSQLIAYRLEKFCESKNLEVKQLIEKSDLRKQFIADISHELKSPLFSAQGYVLTLIDGAIKDKAVREKFLKKAARSLDYIDTLIQDLLTLSQLESDAIRMMPDHFDLVALAKEVLDERETKASKAGVTLNCEHDISPAIVYGDFIRITQVLNNLVNNGINYNMEGGRVTIKITDTEKGVLISVIDTGVGIAERYHERIFNRFFRIDKSRTVKKSTGLGLAIVKHILERHNTQIMLESAAGQGSAFSFLLARDKTLSGVS